MSDNALEILKTDKDALLAALRNAGATVNGDLAHIRCPWHGDDKTGSISVSQKSDAWLWRCHVCDAGGSIVDVVARAEKLETKAACKRALEVYGNATTAAKKPATRAANAGEPQAPLTFKDLDAAAAHYERATKHGCTRRDVYNGLDGAPVMAVLRLDSDTGKTFRPIHKNGVGWKSGDPPGKLPLFNLDKLAADTAPAVIVEGEACAGALAALGYLATTSAHGAKAAGKTDWTPLAGRDVTIWPDHDEPGRDYSRAVQSILAALTPPGRVRIVDPERAMQRPAEGADVCDLLDELDGEGKDAAAKRATIQAILDAASEPPPAADTTPPFVFAGELVKAFPKMRAPIVHGLLREGETLNCIAPPKTGKSWLTLDLAFSIATGTPFLGFDTVRGRVLILDNELHAETIAYRLPKVAEARGISEAQYADRIAYHPLRGQLKDIHSLASYFDRIEPGQFQVIILDAFYRFLPKDTDENDNGSMAALYNKIDAYADRLRCAFELIHHTSKGLQTGRAVTDVGAGAGAISRAADCHLILRAHKEEGAFVLDAAPRSWPPVKPRCLRFEFPLWKSAPELDPADLMPARRPKAAKPEAQGEPPAPEWTTARFIAQFVGTEPRTKGAIFAQAEEHKISEYKATGLLRRAVGSGKVFKWNNGNREPASFATVKQPEFACDSVSGFPLDVNLREPHTHTPTHRKRKGKSHDRTGRE